VTLISKSSGLAAQAANGTSDIYRASNTAVGYSERQHELVRAAIRYYNHEVALGIAREESPCTTVTLRERAAPKASLDVPPKRHLAGHATPQ